MVVVENFYPGYDGMSKKIINWHIADSLETAKKAVKEYIKRFFPKDVWKHYKEENENIIVHRLERIGSNFGNARDIEYITIHKFKSPMNYNDFVNVFDKYQEMAEKRYRDLMGMGEYDFENVTISYEDK